jgi:BON domain
MHLVQDDCIPAELHHDELVCITLREWYGRRAALRDVEVTVMNGVAILRGCVTTPNARTVAIELALAAGAHEVQDELRLNWPLAA